ncbi:MAG: hypothetical protein HC772_17380 [Leptolyngbyaceae cyanobacterium CRU_2_3]|nr:hypothetical protein [Leptolyngbyaceae cyanobacterium CRU_2_3]
MSLDWEQAFPEIIQSGGFDLVIGNPPYLDSEWMTVHLPDWRRYCTAKYQTATGNWDLFCVFIEKALSLCKPGGFTSLVVPNKLASAPYAATTRSLLVQQTRLLEIRDYSGVAAFRAAVYPLVYVAQKQEAQKQEAQKQEAQPAKSVPPITMPATLCEQMQNLDQVGRSTQLLLANTNQPWRIGVWVQQADWIDRLQAYPKLADIAQVMGAATVAEAYALAPWIQDQADLRPSDLKLANSGTIDRYSFLWGKKPLRYLGQTYLHPVILAEQLANLPLKRRQQAQQPKIIVAGMSQVLECALDLEGCMLAGKSTSVIQKLMIQENVAIDLRYLVGLLNSHLLSVYFCNCFGGNRLQGGYLRIGPPHLRQLPMPIPTHALAQRSYEQITAWVDDRLKLQADIESGSARKAIDRLEAEINQQVYRLYDLTSREINALTKN